MPLIVVISTNGLLWRHIFGAKVLKFSKTKTEEGKVNSFFHCTLKSFSFLSFPQILYLSFFPLHSLFYSPLTMDQGLKTKRRSPFASPPKLCCTRYQTSHHVEKTLAPLALFRFHTVEELQEGDVCVPCSQCHLSVYSKEIIQCEGCLDSVCQSCCVSTYDGKFEKQYCGECKEMEVEEEDSIGNFEVEETLDFQG